MKILKYLTKKYINILLICFILKNRIVKTGNSTQPGSTHHMLMI